MPGRQLGSLAPLQGHFVSSAGNSFQVRHGLAGVRRGQGDDGRSRRGPVRPHRGLPGGLHAGQEHRQGGFAAWIHLQLPLQTKGPGRRRAHHVDQGLRKEPIDLSTIDPNSYAATGNGTHCRVAPGDL